MLGRVAGFTLGDSLSDPGCFNDPRELTNSNWQGPVWFPLNWFVFHSLLRYGFANDVEALVVDTEKGLAGCISRFGYMRENYDAETGEGLYADRFGSWNILADIMGDFRLVTTAKMQPSFERRSAIIHSR